MEKFKISSKDHFRHLWMYIYMVLCSPLMIYVLMIYKWGYYDKAIATIVIIGGVTTVSLVHLALHLNYFSENRNSEFCYDRNTGDIQYIKGDVSKSFTINDVLKITVYKSKPLSQKKTPIYVWDEYNYAVIELKDGNLLNISSLLVNELDKIVEFDNIEVKNTFYAWIS